MYTPLAKLQETIMAIKTPVQSRVALVEYELAHFNKMADFSHQATACHRTCFLSSLYTQPLVNIIAVCSVSYVLRG